MPKRGIELGTFCSRERCLNHSATGREIPVTYIFSGLEKAVYWIKKKIFKETDFYDNTKKKMSQMNIVTFFLPFREKF